MTNTTNTTDLYSARWVSKAARIVKTEKSGWCAYLDIVDEDGQYIDAVNICRGISSREVAEALVRNWVRDFAAPAQVPAQDDSLTTALQVTGAHCARYCEAQAFLITMRNLHAEIERLRTCNKAAQHEIANLQAAQAQPVKTGSTFHGEIMSTKQPEALRLAEWLEGIRGRTWPSCTPQEAAAELRRLQSENEQLRAGYLAARLEIESLQAQPVATIYVTEDGSREVDDWKVALPVGATTLYTAAPTQPMTSNINNSLSQALKGAMEPSLREVQLLRLQASYQLQTEPIYANNSPHRHRLR